MTNSLGFWTLHAYEFLPTGAKVRKVSMRPKTTFERTYVSTNPDKLNWVVIEWEIEKIIKVTKISVK